MRFLCLTCILPLQLCGGASNVAHSSNRQPHGLSKLSFRTPKLQQGHAKVVAAVRNAEMTLSREMTLHNKTRDTKHAGDKVQDDADAPSALRQRSYRQNVSEVHSTPRVFFLFLTTSGMNNTDLWQDFFSGMDTNKYRIFMHCTDHASCASLLADHNPLDVTLVDTVPSLYCYDLVSPMVHLLKSATLKFPTGSNSDKFVFLSESTLPVKPFDEVYRTLTSHRNSDFCIMPEVRWTQNGFVPAAHPIGVALFVKHSQWVVLNREHSRVMVDRWPKVNIQPNWSWAVPLWSDNQSDMTDTVTFQRRRSSCTDEWAIFATIYGAIVDTGRISEVSLPNFGSSSLRLKGDVTSVQGSCTTFAVWKDNDSHQNPQNHLAEALLQQSQTELSCFPQCNGSHPSEFRAISDSGVAVLRKSSFLFARKFGQHVLSRDQFNRIILSRL